MSPVSQSYNYSVCTHTYVNDHKQKRPAPGGFQVHRLLKAALRAQASCGFAEPPVGRTYVRLLHCTKYHDNTRGMHGCYCMFH